MTFRDYGLIVGRTSSKIKDLRFFSFLGFLGFLEIKDKSDRSQEQGGPEISFL
jgi:hypothetical protein